MNKSQQIYFNTGNTGNDKYMKFTLEQEVDTLEFLSMSIETKDIYQDFNSDYGVLVGRITANGGVGIPNAKVSIFIPLADEDVDNGEISTIYPYKTPRDKDFNGKRYNLLPRVSTINHATSQWSPKQPFGSFPIKEEIVSNILLMDIYKKYYKFTTISNHAGDYMIFGVPTGTQIVHMSVDITDIGEFSMNPASMVNNLGYSPNLFTTDKSKIKASNDLSDLPNIETQEISVDIIPFWGDTTNFEIGITRQDFRIRAELSNSITIFGSVFTDSEDTTWGELHNDNRKDICELYRINVPGEKHISISTKRSINVTEKIYYYPSNITDAQITGNTSFANPSNMEILDKSKYSSYKKDGDFVFIINANRNKITTDELGNKIRIDDDSPYGLFTQFRGFITFEITEKDAPINANSKIDKDIPLEGYRYRVKIPQHADSGLGFIWPSDPRLGFFDPTIEFIDNATLNDMWRREHYTFDAGKFYSISKFHGLTKNNNDKNSDQLINQFGFLNPNVINNCLEDPNWNVGIIVTNDYNGVVNNNEEFPSNSTMDDGIQVFGANWMNFSLYLQQSGYVQSGYWDIKNNRTADNFSKQYSSDETAGSDFFLGNGDNGMEIAANDYNTKKFARSDLHWTDFIEVPVDDIVTLNTQNKGYKYNPDTGATLIGKYRSGRLDYIPTGWNAACPLKNGENPSVGGKLNGNLFTNTPDPNIYFFKGIGNSDCIQYLYELGLVN